MRDLDLELKKVIQFAEENDNIRGLVLQGSYVNDNAKKDIFSDLDPLFYVRDVNEFIHDSSWKSYFGEVISEWGDGWKMKDGLTGYTRLTIYRDGFKIDFGFQDIKLAKYANDMELYKVYVDKDDIIPTPEVTDERKFYDKKPTNEEFQGILTDFFFDTSYVVKTLYRDEVTFNGYMMNILHEKVRKLAEWYIACKTDFKTNTGALGKYMKYYLTESEYQMIKDCYKGYSKEETKEALLNCFKAVRYFGNYTALKLGYNYQQKHDEDMYQYCLEWLDK